MCTSSLPTCAHACLARGEDSSSSHCERAALSALALTHVCLLVVRIPGPDGCSSAGSHALLKYLLFGATPLESVSSSSELSADEAADELIVGVHAEGVRIACAPRMRPAIERVTRLARGVEITSRRLHSSSSSADIDAEADEDELFKIHAFISMTRDFPRVLVPTMYEDGVVGSAASVRARSEIESWPLVQAFGLDELGRHGFFTLSHEISAMPIAQMSELADVDAAYIVHLLSDRLPAFTSQFRGACSRLLQSAVEPAAAAHGAGLTVAQLNQEARAWWEYGLDSLSSADRAHRIDVSPPGVAVFGPTGAARHDDETPVRAAGAKHYSTLPAFYSRLLAAQPYLPLSSLLPLLSSHSRAPLHALVTLADPLSQLRAVRTVLLRHVTPDQENELEVFEHLVPDDWKKKRKRIVAAEGDEDEEDEEEPAESEVDSSEEEESDSDSADDSSDDSPRPSKKSPSVPPTRPAVARLKKESPGLKDALLLHVLYESIVDVARGIISELANAAATGAAFPSFTQVRTRVLARVERLAAAKWVLPRYFDALRTQTYTCRQTHADTDVLSVELSCVDAFGHRTVLDLSAPVPLEPRRLYSFALHLRRIPSRELLSLTDDDLVIGDVGFGESFVWNQMATVQPAATSVDGADEAAEKRRREEDPTYYGTGLTSSSAIDAAATAAAAARSSQRSSLLVLTASLPSRIILPSFFQSFESKALACLLGSYAHASASSSVMPAAEVAALGLVPQHAQLGRFIVDGFVPRLQSNLLATPPSSAPGATIGLHGAAAFVVPVFVPQRIERGMQSLLLARDDAFLASSPLALSCTLLLSSGSCAALEGSIVFFERGFVFTSAAVGSFLVDFKRHLLESAFFDGTLEAEEGGHDDDDEEEEDGEGDDDADDEDDTGDGDALFTMDILTPAESESTSTPYTLLRSLDASSEESLAKLAPTANEGVAPRPSRFASACASLALVLPRGSNLRRTFVSTVAPVWRASLESLDIHNDTCDTVPAFARAAYDQLQERHEFQRRETRRAKRTGSGAHAEDSNLILPHATCDFLADLRIHEQMRAHDAHGERSQANTEVLRQAHTLLSHSSSSSTATPVGAAAAVIPVSVVLGVPGAGHSDVISSVRESSLRSGASIAWSEVIITAEGRLDQECVSQQVTRDLADVVASAPPAPQRRVLVVISAYEGVVRAVTLLQSALVAASSSTRTFAVSSVTTLLHAGCFFVSPSHSRLVPGVADQGVSGWSQGSVLVTPAPPASSADEALVTDVRRRIAVMRRGWPTRVRVAGRRLAFADIADLLCGDEFARPAESRRRLRDALAHVYPSPRVLALRPAATRLEFFHLPGEVLLDRARFFAAIAAFTRQRDIYHTDEERDDDARDSADHLARLLPSGAAPPPPSSSLPAGRITFTTSSSSLPAAFSVLHVVAMIKFEDVVSNAGGVSHRFHEVRAANGRVLVVDRRDCTGEDSAAAAAAAASQKETVDGLTDDETVDPSDRTHSDTSIPMSALPLELASHVRSASHSSSLPSPLTVSSTSCLLMVSGTGDLTRGDVRTNLLLPSVRPTRPYEKADSRWNEEVRRHQQLVREA